MTEYKVVMAEVTSLVWRDVGKAAEALSKEVMNHIEAGWEPQGGIATVPTGTTIYLIQAVIKRR
jgi:hypothetical protein